MKYQKNKQMLVERAKHHKDADEIIQGKYWDGTRGCCVGCLAETSYKPHIKLSEMTNVPVWVFYLADEIHEFIQDYNNWPVRFSEALAKTPNDGKFLKYSVNLWKIFICDFLLENEKIWREQDTKDEYVSEVVKAINLVKKYAKDEMSGKEVDWSAARSAESAAWSAAEYAGRSAARSAAYERMADKFIKILECGE